MYLATKKCTYQIYILGVPEGPCDIAELGKFQAVLPEFQIQVFSATSAVELLYKGPEAHKIIYLILDENAQHYNVITGKIDKEYKYFMQALKMYLKCY